MSAASVTTNSFIARKANKTPSSILQMPLDAAWLFTRGVPPREVRKYKLESHPLYSELPECSVRQRDEDLLPAPEELEGISIA